MAEFEQPQKPHKPHKPKKILITAALLCGLLAGNSVRGQAQEPAPNMHDEEIAMTVGEHKITVGEFETLLKNLPPQYNDSVRALGKRGFADQYAYLLAMAAEGEKLKIDQRDDVRLMLSFQRLLTLAQMTLNELAVQSVSVTPDEMSAYYNSNQKEFEEQKLRGIYVAFEPEPGASGNEPAGPDDAARPKRNETDARARAEALRNRIVGGEAIAKLAETESDHPTASQGGDFGYVRRNQFAPQVENAIFSLAPNEVSAPVRDRFGYFIFLVEDKRIQPLEQARQTIENILRQQKVVAILERVRKDHPAVFNPRYFPPETPASAPGSPAR